ncbi:MAG TPA: cell wall-binding repeat-containing protein, partial [Egibacteraceae bacterium]|nr:cell wall-binding repeat-containing protein [Egibacteraceae bacterium]
MRHRGRGQRWRAWAAGLALTFALTVVPGPIAASSVQGGVTRVAGPQRIATAVAASRAAWPDGSDTAVVTTAAGYADAVAAAPLAAALGAPVLLSDPAVLPGQATEELARLGAGDIVVVGGRAAVGDA